MGGIWAAGPDGAFEALAAHGFKTEADLHELIERTPSMLPLAGKPPIAVVGREVKCGHEWADLVGVEADTGRPVVIEVKLAANTDRRKALTQVLGYAAYVRRLDADGFASLFLKYLADRGYDSIAAAAQAAAQDDPNFSPEGFDARLNDALKDGRLRAVLVFDDAPLDLVELVGYLQDVTNDRLTLDLVVVSSYELGDQRIVVPQLVEPDRSQLTAEAAGTGKPLVGPEIVQGADAFVESIDSAPEPTRPLLLRLLSWARGLGDEGLAELYTSKGKDRSLLNLRVPGQARGMVLIWNERGAYLSPYRTVFQQLAPRTLAALDDLVPGQIGQGNYIKGEYEDKLLDLLRRAYAEASQAVADGPAS